ncbi:uncharacterized protein LOC134612265 [Pelobates fuscus]|uniref:uncharacterized protein LOC134612265 n=1 Tax=Pelobates fuscus TaxID=191477 RepID=UPI002FE44170
MPKCIVKKCKNRQRGTGAPFSLHTFPCSPKRIKSWLLATGEEYRDINLLVQNIHDEKKRNTFRMCSDHFAAEAYSTAGQRKFLKPDAVPTIFACNEETTPTSKEKPTPHLCIKPELMETDAPVVTYMNLVPSLATIESQENSGMFSSYPSQNELLDHDYSEKLDYSVLTSKFMFHKASNTEVVRTSKKGTITSNYYGKRSLKTQTSVFQGKRNAQTSTREDRVMKDAFTWTGPLEDDIKLSSEYYKKPSFTDAYTQTDNAIQFSELQSTLSKPHPATLVETQFTPQPVVGVISDTPLAVETTPQQHITTGDPDLIPECEEHVGYHTFERTPEDFVSEKKFLVFDSCLDQLLSKVKLSCHADTCKSSIITVEKNIIGTLLTVYLTCENNHRNLFWRSQPMVGTHSCGNILSSAAVLLSGLHYSKLHEMFSILGVPYISKTVHSDYQKNFIFPVIHLHHTKDRHNIIDNLKDKAICLSGDGQSGHSVFSRKYCMYTLIEESTQKIIECNTIRVSERKSSIDTESKVFRKCLNKVLDEGLIVAYLATDRHIGITKIMRDEYRQINHQFDLWHYCRHLKRKLSRLAKRKTCKPLIPWRKAIINQMWMSSSQCKGNVNLMREQWNSVLLHVVNQHRWDSGTLIDGCPHSELLEKDMGSRPWLVRDSPVHLQLTNFVKNKQLQKDLKQMTHFCHTGSIKVFRSLVLKFCPKHVRFSKDGMAARIKLAVLAHNANVEKPQTTIKKVGVKHWHVNNISKTQTVDHVYPMLADILRHVSGELDVTWVSERCLCSEMPQRNGHR